MRFRYSFKGTGFESKLYELLSIWGLLARPLFTVFYKHQVTQAQLRKALLTHVPLHERIRQCDSLFNPMNTSFIQKYLDYLLAKIALKYANAQSSIFYFFQSISVVFIVNKHFIAVNMRLNSEVYKYYIFFKDQHSFGRISWGFISKY